MVATETATPIGALKIQKQGLPLNLQVPCTNSVIPLCILAAQYHTLEHPDMHNYEFMSRVNTSHIDLRDTAPPNPFCLQFFHPMRSLYWTASLLSHSQSHLTE